MPAEYPQPLVSGPTQQNKEDIPNPDIKVTETPKLPLIPQQVPPTTESKPHETIHNVQGGMQLLEQ